MSWLSARIAHTMQEHGVDLRSASRWEDAGTHPAVPELKRLHKTVTIRCTAERLHTFLEALNRLSFVVVVENLSVMRDEELGAVSAEIELATFVLRADEALSQAPAPGRDHVD